ncbi:nucleolin [Anopheles moucheti]|uniref:nucleolin n=1 Tax=Anopheles moucheti TaxID=186751 RepID=UPI0022EFF84F|nr:nucleolin [Anopheles moucheti]
MRSRTEMVTTTLDGSDFDEETDFEDSEEDWRPEKGGPKALKRKTRDILTGTVGGKRGGRSKGGRRGRKPAAKSRGPGRRRKFDEDYDDDEDDDEDDDDDRFDSAGSGSSTPPVPKRGRKSSTTPQRAYGRKSENKTPPSTSKGALGQIKLSPNSSVSGLDCSGAEHSVKPIQRKVANLSGSFPDKSGYLKLFASRADLEEGIRDNLKVCLWRRDGSSLLQKYFRDKSVDASTPQFTSSMVYSCWEDKRADEYMEVKVRCVEQSKQLRVQIIDVEATECRAKEEYQKYIEKYGKSIEDHDTDRSNGDRSGSASSGAKKTHDGSNNGDNDDHEEADEEDYDEEHDDEEMMLQGAKGSDDPSQEE